MISKNIQPKASFIFKRTNKTVSDMDGFWREFDLLSVFDSWQDGSLLPFLKLVSPDKYYRRLKDKVVEMVMFPIIDDNIKFAGCLFTEEFLPGFVSEQLQAIRRMESFTASDTFTAGSDCVLHLPEWIELEMIWCNPGTFMMGSPENELGREESEIYHEVTLEHGFWLGKYPVTHEQYQLVTGKTSPFYCAPHCAMNTISRDEAMDFCRRVNDLFGKMLPDGYQFDLPSEAQWEYACRAGTTTGFSNGREYCDDEREEDFLGDICWCPEVNDIDEFCGWSICELRPVGRYAPNPRGFYDMHGNVYEWCSDIRLDEKDRSEYCVAKGGSCIDIAYSMSENCRSAALRHYMRGDYEFDTGFRLALKKIEEL